MIIGYARVSTTERNLDLQRDALKRAGCEKIIEDTVSGGKVQRPGLERVHDALRSGEVLAVWRLDRLGRSLKHLIELMAELEAERIGFQSVTESRRRTAKANRYHFGFGKRIATGPVPCTQFPPANGAPGSSRSIIRSRKSSRPRSGARASALRKAALFL